MRIAYLECFSGISGDMFLGALLDAGVPPEIFTTTVEALGVDARLEIAKVDRSGISATKLDVIAAGEKELPREEFWENQQANQPRINANERELGEHKQHTHDHAQHQHERPHDHEHHDHSHEHQHDHPHEHRGLKEIRQIIG